ncbi:NUDIX domain-containing protein [Actinomadura rupiterrae]|uniref:NUDIX domain-containing protein n=1 Tax=Actinomadura rupiterrae TaxID=559627 RepID=UPI0020A2F0CE|nr:NUDIX domain-containing protein [Actinomadura rupiterrae]MCP2342220.1 8-oxo-dGTP pyrophosphatase MutT (NUDIX family) [Actinomadura rupiterrae]
MAEPSGEALAALGASGWFGTWVAPHMLLRRDDDAVLLIRRANTGYRDGWLAPPAGRIEPGEDVLAAAIRETAEEVGVHVRRDDARFVHLMHRYADTMPGPCHAVMDCYFTAQEWTGEPFVAEPDKCSEILWVHPESLPPRVIPHVVEALTAVRERRHFSTHNWAPEARFRL